MDWDAHTETPVSPIMAEHQQQQGSFSDLLSIGNSEVKASSSRSNNNGNIDDIMNLFNTPSNSGVQTFATSPQKQQQHVMDDFTNDLFGSATTQSPVQQNPPSSKNTSTNDPFADLF